MLVFLFYFRKWTFSQANKGHSSVIGEFSAAYFDMSWKQEGQRVCAGGFDLFNRAIKLTCWVILKGPPAGRAREEGEESKYFTV